MRPSPATSTGPRKGDVRLFLWEKFVGSPDGKPAVLFVHGSSMASQPTFDLDGARPARFVGDGLVRAARLRLLDASTWKATAAPTRRATSTATSPTAPTTSPPPPTTSPRRAACAASSPTASRRARCARRCSRSAIPSAWRGSRSTPSCGPAKARRRSSSGARSCRSSWRRKRRPIDRAFVHSIFERDHPDCAEPRVVDAFADAILALDDSMPNGTYIDMCSKLPVVDPAQITVPTLVLRGQYDGIAGVRRPDRVLQAPAQSRQAVHRDGRHLARELPAEELPDGLPHPARVLHAARAGLHGVTWPLSTRAGANGKRARRFPVLLLVDAPDHAFKLTDLFKIEQAVPNSLISAVRAASFGILLLRRAQSGAASAAPLLDVSRTSISFGRDAAGAEFVQPLFLTNVGDAPLTFSGFPITGKNQRDYRVGGTCSLTSALLPGGRCRLDVIGALSAPRARRR